MVEYAASDFLNYTLNKVKEYVVNALSDAGITATVVMGWPDFTSKLPLERCYVSITSDTPVSLDSVGYGDIAEVANVGGERVIYEASIATIDVAIDIFTSRGSSTNPSPSGGKTGGQRTAAILSRSFTYQQYNLFDDFPECEDIERFSINYSRSPSLLDEDDIFQVNCVLRLRVVVE